MFQKLITYLKESKAEMVSVNWPTKKQTGDFTALVIGVSLFVALYLGFLDKIFTFLLEKFIL